MVQKVFSQLEALSRWLQLKYMQSRRTTEKIEEGRLLFHPKSCREWVLREYQKKLNDLKIPLDKP